MNLFEPKADAFYRISKRDAFLNFSDGSEQSLLYCRFLRPENKLQ